MLGHNISSNILQYVYLLAITENVTTVK